MPIEYSYDELESFAGKIYERMVLASETGNYSDAFEDVFTEDAIYERAQGPMLPDAIAYGKDEILQIALGSDLGDLKGWRYLWKDFWIDEMAGVVVILWEMISPWKDCDSGRYFQRDGVGYTIHYYAGNMKSKRQIDICETQQLQYVQEEGIAAGLAGDLLIRDYKMKRKKQSIARDSWELHLEELRKETQKRLLR